MNVGIDDTQWMAWRCRRVTHRLRSVMIRAEKFQLTISWILVEDDGFQSNCPATDRTRPPDRRPHQHGRLRGPGVVEHPARVAHRSKRNGGSVLLLRRGVFWADGWRGSGGFPSATKSHPP